MHLFALAVKNAGADLTADKVATAMEGITNYPSRFGGPAMNFSAEDHLGPDRKNGTTLFKVDGKKCKLVQQVSY
jgi:branched-chain amino acid transport system substrate-binding protein